MSLWECEAWAECRSNALRILARLSRRTLTRPLEHYSRWPKWVRSTGLVPGGRKLDQQNLELARGENRRADGQSAGATREMGSGGNNTVHLNEVGQVIVYTDGGCTDPRYRKLRRATYGGALR